VAEEWTTARNWWSPSKVNLPCPGKWQPVLRKETSPTSSGLKTWLETFRERCWVPLQGWRRNQRKAGSTRLIYDILSFFTRKWKWRRCTPWKFRLTFNELQGVISQEDKTFLQHVTSPETITKRKRFERTEYFVQQCSPFSDLGTLKKTEWRTKTILKMEIGI
jgi:hypothetical protein